MTKNKSNRYESAHGGRDIEQELKHGRELHDYAVGKTIVSLISGLVPSFKSPGVPSLESGIQGVKS